MKLSKTILTLIISLLLIHIIVTFRINETSFAEIKSEVKVKSLLRNKETTGLKGKLVTEAGTTAKLTVRDLLMATTGGMKKNRVTVLGNKCMKIFKFNNKEYNDCTLDRSPDGQIPEKEWCMIVPTDKTNDIWQFCKPDMDYDKIRFEVQNIIKGLTEESRKIIDKLNEKSLLEDKKINQHLQLITLQGSLFNKINSLYSDSLATSNAIDYLRKIKVEWEELESKAVIMAQEIEKNKESVKVIKTELKEISQNKANTESSHKKYSEDEIKLESQGTKMLIAPWIQDKEQILTKDCTGLLNYEEEQEGTGLLAKYFSNPTFSGNFSSRIDSTINFSFTKESPMPGINSNNFSIQWDGFIQPPINAKYTFTIITDGGAEVFINGEQIINHNMFMSQVFQGKRSIILTNFKNNKNNTSSKTDKVSSKEIQLSGGDKYIIRVKYYHSVHDRFDESVNPFIKLSWNCDAFDDEVIESQFLFPNSIIPPTKISGVDPEIGVIRNLSENGLAFNDSTSFILQDIPHEYQGNSSLKLSSTYKLNKIEFKTNVTLNVYIGKIDYYKRPFNDDFENLNQFMSLLEVQKPDEKNLNGKSFSAQSSVLVRIYKKKFKPGLVRIPLNNSTGLSRKGNPLIVFFGADSSSTVPMACGGETVWLSNPNSDHFSKCETSSSYSTSSWICRSGLSGKMSDNPTSMWASNNEGIGAFMLITFKDLKEVSRIHYIDRLNPQEQNSILEFEFSGGEIETWNHKKSSTEEVIEFLNPYRTYWVKVTIKAVYGTINNGFALKIFGTNCSAQENPEGKKNVKTIISLFDVQQNKEYNLGCYESVSNSKKLFNVDKNPGKCITINCLDSCSGTDATIYGNGFYSKDSAICKAALHSKMLNFNGGKVKLCFGPEQFNLVGTIENGVQSKSKTITELSIKFEKSEEEEYIIKKVGTKFDVKDSGSKYLPAVITKIISPDKNDVEYNIIGENSTSKSIKTVDISKIKGDAFPCGAKIANRDCGQAVSNKINIRFTPRNYNSKGNYVKDFGEIYGTERDGKYLPYGWSRDMTSNIKTSSISNDEGFENYKNISQSYIEFPPDQKSHYCSSNKVNCESSSYSIKAGLGKFKVKIFVDIVEANTSANFSVNGISFAKNEEIFKGQKKIFEGVVESIDSMIEITSECTVKCFDAISRMNMIQIYPYSEQEKTPATDNSIIEGEICNGKYKLGKDCENGTSDVKFCAFQNEKSLGFRKCNGTNTIVKIPLKFIECPDVRGLYYCIPKTKEYLSKFVSNSE